MTKSAKPDQLGEAKLGLGWQGQGQGQVGSSSDRWMGGLTPPNSNENFSQANKKSLYLDYYPILYTNKVLRFILYIHNLVQFGRTQANIPPL